MKNILKVLAAGALLSLGAAFAQQSSDTSSVSVTVNAINELDMSAVLSTATLDYQAFTDAALTTAMAAGDGGPFHVGTNTTTHDFTINNQNVQKKITAGATTLSPDIGTQNLGLFVTTSNVSLTATSEQTAPTTASLVRIVNTNGAATAAQDVLTNLGFGKAGTFDTQYVWEVPLQAQTGLAYSATITFTILDQ